MTGLIAPIQGPSIVELTRSPGPRETVDCRVCGSSHYSQFLAGRGYNIVQCQACGLRYINPQPTDAELRDFYAEFDAHGTWRGDGEERFDGAVRDVVLRFRKTGSVLDIGSSRGNFLISMKRAGFSVYGVEPSPKNSEFARTVNGVGTFTASAEEFLASPARTGFDVVTMLNVLEHVKDPGKVLSDVRALLSQNGIVVLVVPDARLHAAVGKLRETLDFSDPYFMGNLNRPLVGFDPPAHICSFEPRLIRRLVESCGFETLTLRNAPIILTRDSWKNLLKPILYGFSQALYLGSMKRIVWGYSTLMVARKK